MNDTTKNGDREAVEVLNPTTVQLLQTAEIDQQIATAKKWPRSITRFVENARSIVTMSPVVAAACTYALPRREDGVQKIIRGPAARLAEIIGSQWGNCRYGGRIVAEDDRFVTAQGVFHDLEHNSFVTVDVRRRITDRSGRRYSADMIGVTSNAAVSIALRNAVLKGVPKAIWEPVWLEAQVVAAGDKASLEQRRENMFAKFGELGVKPAEIFAALGVDGKADIGLDEMVVLGGFWTAINDGDQSVDSLFRGRDGDASAVEDEDLNRDLGLAGADPSRPEADGEGGAEKKPAGDEKPAAAKGGKRGGSGGSSKATPADPGRPE